MQVTKMTEGQSGYRGPTKETKLMPIKNRFSPFSNDATKDADADGVAVVGAFASKFDRHQSRAVEEDVMVHRALARAVISTRGNTSRLARPSRPCRDKISSQIGPNALSALLNLSTACTDSGPEEERSRETDHRGGCSQGCPGMAAPPRRTAG